tara:strand:- start:57 stop:593 length:537 start_codon:yes stop_codon:yes gene_type:complete
MGKTTFSGPVSSLGGFYSAGKNSVVDVPNGTASFTIGTTSGYDVADYAGKLITLSDAAMTITLPTISAADPADPTAPSQLNNLGLIFRFFVALDSTAMIINCGGSDVFVGGVYIGVDDAATGESQRSDGSDNTFTMNGSTQGGDAGSYVEFEAAAALTWSVRGDLLGSSSIITPFTTV